MDEEKTISQMFEEIREAMCDKYCKYPEKYNCDDEDEYNAMMSFCENCPLNRL